MKKQSTTHKAEGLGSEGKPETLKTEMLKLGGVDSRAGSKGLRHTEMLKAEIQNGSVPQLDNDEQLVLDTIMRAIRGLRNCGRPRVADIARQWERIFNYRIQVTMQERQRRAKAKLVRMRIQIGRTSPQPSPQRGEGERHAATSVPSALRIRLSVSPNRG